MPSFYSFKSFSERNASKSKSTSSSKNKFNLSLLSKDKIYNRSYLDKLDYLCSNPSCASVESFQLHHSKHELKKNKKVRLLTLRKTSNQIDKQLQTNKGNYFNGVIKKNQIIDKDLVKVSRSELNFQSIKGFDVTKESIGKLINVKLVEKTCLKRKRAPENDKDKIKNVRKKIKYLQDEKSEKNKTKKIEQQCGTKKLNRKTYANYHNKKLKIENFPYPRKNYLLQQNEEMDEKLTTLRPTINKYNLLFGKKSDLNNINKKILKSCLKKEKIDSTIKNEKQIHFYEVLTLRRFWKDDPSQCLREESIGIINILENYKGKALKYMNKIF